MSRTADAVVIGAGVMGCSVALELARRGLAVITVDKGGGPGMGSTSSSSAIVRFNYSNEAGVSAAWESYHLWKTWSDHLEMDDETDSATYVETGLVLLDTPLVPREQSRRLFEHAGIPYEEWDDSELSARVPGIDPGRYWPPKRIDDDEFWAEHEGHLGAVFTPHAGFVQDPHLATLNLAAAARRSGAELVLRSTVVDVLRSRSHVSGVRLASGDEILAPVVVNAAGPWSRHVNAVARVGDDFTVGVRPLRQEVHHVPAPPSFTRDGRPGPVIADLDLGTYMRAELGGGLLIGGTEPECDPLEWLDDPDDSNPNPTMQIFEAQVTRAARRFPALGVPNRPSGIAGVYDVTDDWTPIYDRTELDGFYVAIGTSGNQFKNAPLVGQMMSTIIDRVESGHDHDGDPIQFVGEHTGHVIDLASFSRKRSINFDSSGTVFG